MAFDGFMWFVGPKNGAVKVEGETLDKSYAPLGAFSIKSFSVDVENPTSIGSSGGGAGTGKAKLNPFKVSKWTDNCSPSLLKTCCMGGHYQQAHIVVRKAGTYDEKDKTKAAGLEYLHFIFYMVYVSQLEWSGESEDELPGENVTFAYGALTMQYTPQSSEGGKRAVNTQEWNQVNNSSDIKIAEFTAGGKK